MVGHPRKQDDTGKIPETMHPVRRRSLYQCETAGNRVGNEIDIDDTGCRKPTQRKRGKQQQEGPIGKKKFKPFDQRIINGRGGRLRRIVRVCQWRLEPEIYKGGKAREQDGQDLIGIAPAQRGN